MCRACGHGWLVVRYDVGVTSITSATAAAWSRRLVLRYCHASHAPLARTGGRPTALPVEHVTVVLTSHIEVDRESRLKRGTAWEKKWTPEVN